MFKSKMKQDFFCEWGHIFSDGIKSKERKRLIPFIVCYY
jgi:hypothetical protein